MKLIAFDRKLGNLSSTLHVTILDVQRCCARLGMHVPDYFISALEILPRYFMGAAPLHTYICDFVKCILHLYVLPIRDMKSLRV